jgi:ubiquinone/menaquinone biosynthesis C-methylase UbiE
MPVDSTKRFSTRVPYYVRSRPGYPSALLDFFRSELSLQAEHMIADIGSGTGILSQLFLQNGNRVYCVEPNAEMRAAGESKLSRFPKFRSVNGTAEATTLPDASVDFVTAGQAFHWFDPLKSAAEFGRILKPGGWAALIWNERRTVNTGFNAAYDQFIDAFTGDHATARVRGGSVGTGPAVEQFFGAGGFSLQSFANHQDLNWEGLLDRVYSSSYMPLPDDPVNPRITSQLRELFNQFSIGGVIRIEYQTLVYYGVFCGRR